MKVAFHKECEGSYRLFLTLVTTANRSRSPLIKILELELEHSVRVSALAADIATPCSARVLRPLTVTFSPSLDFEASAVAAALQCVPPVDADFFEELMDDDNVFFEEPLADIVERMASLSHGRDE